MTGPRLANNEGTLYMIYGMDFSVRVHGNPSIRSDERLPSKAWALGVTAYATTHGATWARRVAGMGGKEAREFLSSCMGFPGTAAHWALNPCVRGRYIQVSDCIWRIAVGCHTVQGHPVW